MKKLLILIGLAVAVSITAQAQVSTTFNPITLPNIAAGGSTNPATTIRLDCSKQSTCPIVLSWAMMGTDTSNVVFTFERTGDWVRYDTNAPVTVTLPSAGTTQQTYFTNLTVNGWAGFRVKIANTTSLTPFTNGAIYQVLKKNL
jgi:hypothetical protein